MKSLFASLLFVYFLATAEQSHHEDSNPVVSTPSGSFRGIVLVSPQNRKFKAFRGVPFALPPVGNLRFAKPQPQPPINDIYDATRFRYRCLQAQEVDSEDRGREDCLYLNVYVPLEDSQRKEEKKKVFVYIHGGGGVVGSSNEHVPGDLVALGDIIVVTINYRLGWLGGLKADTPELPGNLATWDQLLALRWVKDNIRSFGGDPDDVAAGGESMGAISVSRLSITPYGTGLFTKGITMSGSALTIASTPESSDDLLSVLAETLGCADESIQAIVTCLRELPEDRYTLPIDMLLVFKFTAVDGDLFPRPIPDLVSDRDYLKRIGFFSRDYLVSMTNNEGLVLIQGLFNLHVDPDNLKPGPITGWLQLPLPVLKKMVAWYRQSNQTEARPVHDILMDATFTIPSFKHLETFASYVTETGETSKSYLLYFDFTPSYLPEPHQGTFHALDLNYVFDHEPAELLRLYYGIETDRQFSESDRQLKIRYIRALSDFIKTGNPGTSLAQELNLTWPPFDIDNENYLAFEPEPRVRQKLLEKRRHFWKHVLPEYIEDFQKSGTKEEL